jgi:hypothetical protein
VVGAGGFPQLFQFIRPGSPLGLWAHPLVVTDSCPSQGDDADVGTDLRCLAKRGMRPSVSAAGSHPEHRRFGQATPGSGIILLPVTQSDPTVAKRNSEKGAARPLDTKRSRYASEWLSLAPLTRRSTRLVTEGNWLATIRIGTITHQGEQQLRGR